MRAGVTSQAGGGARRPRPAVRAPHAQRRRRRAPGAEVPAGTRRRIPPGPGNHWAVGARARGTGAPDGPARAKPARRGLAARGAGHEILRDAPAPHQNIAPRSNTRRSKWHRSKSPFERWPAVAAAGRDAPAAVWGRHPAARGVGGDVAQRVGRLQRPRGEDLARRAQPRDRGLRAAARQGARAARARGPIRPSSGESAVQARQVPRPSNGGAGAGREGGRGEALELKALNSKGSKLAFHRW